MIPRAAVVTVRLDARAYRVSAVPTWVPGWWAWALRVDDRGPGHNRWAILDATGRCLSRTGRWDIEPDPPDRPPGWLGGHRYALADALHRAARVALTVDVDGVRPAEAVTRARTDRDAHRGRR